MSESGTDLQSLRLIFGESFSDLQSLHFILGGIEETLRQHATIGNHRDLITRASTSEWDQDRAIRELEDLFNAAREAERLSNILPDIAVQKKVRGLMYEVRFTICEAFDVDMGYFHYRDDLEKAETDFKEILKGIHRRCSDDLRRLRGECQALTPGEAVFLAGDALTELMNQTQIADYFGIHRNQVPVKVLERYVHEFIGKRIRMRVDDMPPLYHRAVEERLKKMP